MKKTNRTELYIIYPILTVGLFLLTYLLVNPAPNIDRAAVNKTETQQVVINQLTTAISKANSTIVDTLTPKKVKKTTSQKDENIFDYNILLVLLSLTTLVSIFISFWLYRWRKVATSDKEIVVPEVFAQQLQSVLASVNYSNSKMENTIKKQSDAVNQQSNAVNKSGVSLNYLNEEIKGMIETHLKLQSALDQKEDEIKRYKEGYDAKIFHNFLLRFTRVDQVLKDYIRDEGIDETVIDILEDIQEVMEDALAECGVESFSPEEGVDYKTAEGVADNPKKIDTDDESRHFLIAEVLDEGYRRETESSSYKVITQAKVKVYIYKKPETANNSKEQDNTIQE